MNSPMRRTIFMALLAALLLAPPAAHARGDPSNPARLPRRRRSPGQLHRRPDARRAQQPADRVDEYSDCRDVLSRAIAEDRRPSGDSGGDDSGGGGGGSTGGGAGGGTDRRPAAAGATPRRQRREPHGDQDAALPRPTPPQDARPRSTEAARRRPTGRRRRRARVTRHAARRRGRTQRAARHAGRRARPDRRRAVAALAPLLRRRVSSLAPRRRRTYVPPRRALGESPARRAAAARARGPLLASASRSRPAVRVRRARRVAARAHDVDRGRADARRARRCAPPRSPLPRSRGRPARLRGIWLLGAFALLTVFTALSITWSLTPSESWLETSRMLAYLAALAGGARARPAAPAALGALIGAVALSAVALCAWSLLTKVFPGALAPDELFARLRAPFEYWNSVGLAAALGIPPCCGSARAAPATRRSTCSRGPALGVLLIVACCSPTRAARCSRSAIGLALWLALVPLRLRALVDARRRAGDDAAARRLGVRAGRPDARRHPLALRIDAGQAFGGLLLLLLVALTVAGLAVGFLSARHPPGRTRAPRARPRAGRDARRRPRGGDPAARQRPGGIDGQVSKAWKQATDPAATARNSPDRLTAASSVRARYWEEALKCTPQRRARRRRGRLRQAAAALPHDDRARRATRTATSCRCWPTSAGSGSRCRCSRAGAWLAAAARVLGLRRRRPAACPGTRSASGWRRSPSS